MAVSTNSSQSGGRGSQASDFSPRGPPWNREDWFEIMGVLMGRISITVITKSKKRERTFATVHYPSMQQFAMQQYTPFLVFYGPILDIFPGGQGALAEGGSR